MFNLKKFAEILLKISATYENQRDFSRKSSVNRTYISEYINEKIFFPPTPKTLMKLANASNGVTTYDELMYVCGYWDNANKISQMVAQKIFDKNLQNIEKLGYCDSQVEDLRDILVNRKETAYSIEYQISKYAMNCPANDAEIELEERTKVLLEINSEIENALNAEIMEKITNTSNDIIKCTLKDDSMAPLLGIGDIAYVKKSENFNDGETILFNLDGKDFIRKIIDRVNFYEFLAMNPYFPPIILQKEDIEKRRFGIIGKVIKAENQSAFK